MDIDLTRKYTLVRGRTNYVLSGYLLKMGVATLIVGAQTILAIAFSQRVVAPFGTIWLGSSFVLLFVAVGSGFVLFGFARARDAAERAVGYTTALGGNQNFDQVDPETGVVVRAAGATMLTGRQFAQAQILIRKLLLEQVSHD